MIHPLNLSLDQVFLQDKKISVSIYRGDLEHEAAPGNKWHKLRFNLEAAKAQGATHIISFGGPFSNHIHALGNVAKELDITAIAIIRGELQPQLTPTLRDFVSAGGILWPSRRIDYKAGMDSALVKELKALFPKAYWVPEGGSNALGVKGCFHWANSITKQLNKDEVFDTWVLSAGTGATCAGLLAYEDDVVPVPKIMVFPALKGGQALRPEIENLALTQNPEVELTRLTLVADYHHGGYAKLPSPLKDYIETIHTLNPKVILDPVYTAKVVYGLEQEIIKGRLDNCKLLLIHTGGVQGWRGYQ